MIVENEASPCDVCMAQSVAADCEDVPLCAACAADVNTEALAMIAELVGYDGGDIVVAVRDRLAAVEAERDAWHKQADELVVMEQIESRRLRERLEKAEDILSALREPSEAVVEAAAVAVYADPDDVCEPRHRTVVGASIRAAIAAAEKEVGDA